MKSILSEVADERERQIKKWGVQSHSTTFWLAIISEEFGEVSKEVVEYVFAKKVQDSVSMQRRMSNIRHELIQVAAVAVAWIERIDIKFGESK